MKPYEDTELIRNLHKEIPILTAQIRSLYAELDKKFHLNGSKIPIRFGVDRDVLGSYTQAGIGQKEEFYFSLLFIGYSVANPLSKEDRLDLYKHEYAHYMQYNMVIPKQYTWQSGIHGSAWKYCCSLVGAAPTPYYKAGEALMKHDYKKVLRNPIHDKTVPLRDAYHREKDYQAKKNAVVHYKTGDVVSHPTFGKGTVEEIQQQADSVRLHIRFNNDVKVIDQKWLMRSQYQKGGNPNCRS